MPGVPDMQGTCTRHGIGSSLLAGGGCASGHTFQGLRMPLNLGRGPRPPGTFENSSLTQASSVSRLCPPRTASAMRSALYSVLPQRFYLESTPQRLQPYFGLLCNCLSLQLEDPRVGDPAMLGK